MNYKEEIINALTDVYKRAREEGYSEGLKRGEENAAETKKKIARLNYEGKKSCGNCGQPRDYRGDCILYDEGKCLNEYEKWIPR